MLKQFDEQRHRRRTDLPDHFKGVLMQVFIVVGKQSFQQWQRTLRRLDQRGFGSGADLRIVGQQTIGPLGYEGGGSRKARLGRWRR